MKPGLLSQGYMLVSSIVVPQLTGVLGMLAGRESLQTWYPTLRKPSFNLPPSVFGNIWSIMYMVMGVAHFLVRRQVALGQVEPKLARKARNQYATQLTFNALWMPAFFGLKKPLLALIDLVLLVIALGRTIPTFRRISRPAALLLVPYLLWTATATALNASIWWLNRDKRK